jgi:adenosine deaminase CECR1
MLMHPLPMMMNQGVPGLYIGTPCLTTPHMFAVALCSDDPAIFGNMGLSFDFYQASRSNPSSKWLTDASAGFGSK